MALLGNALVYFFQFFFVWLAVGIFLPFVLVFAIVTLIVAGVFHLSCTIHRGMNLTVVVQ